MHTDVVKHATSYAICLFFLSHSFHSQHPYDLRPNCLYQRSHVVSTHAVTPIVELRRTAAGENHAQQCCQCRSCEVVPRDALQYDTDVVILQLQQQSQMRCHLPLN